MIYIVFALEGNFDRIYVADLDLKMLWMFDFEQHSCTEWWKCLQQNLFESQWDNSW